MSADDPAARIEGLLAQHAWVRALARTLVRDDAAADDLTQEAWLAALRAPPTAAGSARGWFGTVLRNAARQAHRGATRRESRESAAARPEAQPGAHEIVSRAEEHRRVVDAVLALEEPYRTTILLRFFDELPPREVAARMGAPVETVRARIRRALERLRGQLDAAHGGDGTGSGEAWRMALLPLAGLGPDALVHAAAAAAGGTASAGSQAGAASSAASSSFGSSLTTGAILMGKSAAVVVGAVALVVGAGVGFGVASAQHREAADAQAAQILKLEARAQIADALEVEVRSSKAAAQSAKGEAAVLEGKLKQAVADLDAERSKSSDTAAALAGAQERLRKYEGTSSSAASAAKPKPEFAFEQFGDVLDRVDWASVAEHTTAIVRPIREIADALLAGQPIPMQAAGEAQKHNGPLIQAVGVLGDKLSGTGPNGTYTHPAFMVNALAVALERIGKPLSAAQRTTIEETGRRFTEEERKRLGAYDDTTFQMKKLVEEGDLKDRFFDRVREILSAEQLDAISPPATRDRLAADLWSEGLLWATVTRPVKFEKKEQIVEVVSRALGAMWKLDDAQKAKVAEIAADWVSRLPQGLVERKPDALEAIGMSQADLVAEAAGETRKLVERVATDLALSGAQLTAARNWGVVFLPVPGDRDE